ncbi:MAG: DUF2892 domain-containing protein [Bacillota bacterium]
MQRNVGTIDAYLRITMGLTMLGMGIIRGIRKNDALSGLLVSAGAMKVAEGTTRYCPMLHALGRSTVHGSDLAVEIEAKSIELVGEDTEDE